MCGEHVEGRPGRNQYQGSSPRVRGTRILAIKVRVPRGIIPACAGNTQAYVRNMSYIWDHPRVCGEHHASFRYMNPFSGSSPRVRGTPRSLPLLRVGVGIIPACAGNTPQSWGRRAATGDHPRVCGEHGRLDNLRKAQAGSSPRVRGTLVA